MLIYDVSSQRVKHLGSCAPDGGGEEKEEDNDVYPHCSPSLMFSRTYASAQKVNPEDIECVSRVYYMWIQHIPIL